MVKFFRYAFVVSSLLIATLVNAAGTDRQRLDYAQKIASSLLHERGDEYRLVQGSLALEPCSGVLYAFGHLLDHLSGHQTDCGMARFLVQDRSGKDFSGSIEVDTGTDIHDLNAANAERLELAKNPANDEIFYMGYKPIMQSSADRSVAQWFALSPSSEEKISGATVKRGDLPSAAAASASKRLTTAAGGL